MKKYKIIFGICCVLTLLMIALVVCALVFEFTGQSAMEFVPFLILAIFVCFYPISFYTCWRLIYDDKSKGKFLYSFIRCVYGGILGGVFLVPLILSPIFIPDFVFYYKQDKKEYKAKREQALKELNIDNV